MERYGLAVVPTLTALLLLSLNDVQFFFGFLCTLFYSFRVQSFIGKYQSPSFFLQWIAVSVFCWVKSIQVLYIIF